MSRHANVAFVLSSSLVFSACLSSHGSTGSTLEVEASIASVTLADDCASAEREAAPGLWAGDCAEGGCPSFCDQTGIRLTIDAAAEGDPVPFEVLAIRLYTMDGDMVDELDPRTAQLFVDGAYVGWDEQIEAGESLHVSYDTDAPDWVSIGNGDPWTTHGMSFRVEMLVRIDGEERTLEFSPASREAEIVT